MTKTYTLGTIGPRVDSLEEKVDNLGIRVDRVEAKLERLQKSVDDLTESFKMMLKIITRMDLTLNEMREDNKIANARLNNHEDRISTLEQNV